MTVQPNALEQKVIETLQQATEFLHTKKINGDTNWTTCLKERLAELGEREGCKICTSGFKDLYNSEWLFDMVWYKENDKKRMTEVPLVVESEWGVSLKQIQFDFEKLLVANSGHRLMICQSNDEMKVDLKNYFQDAIRDYKLNKRHDRYLIAILDTSDEEFEFEVYEK